MKWMRCLVPVSGAGGSCVRTGLQYRGWGSHWLGGYADPDHYSTDEEALPRWFNVNLSGVNRDKVYRSRLFMLQTQVTE